MGGIYLLSASPLLGNSQNEQSKEERVISRRDSLLQEFEHEMLEYINKERKRLDLQPLMMDDPTREVARKHSLDMSTRRYVGHNSPEGMAPHDRLFEGDIYASESAENVAKHLTIKGAHKGLMKSIKHRRNILKPSFTHVGIGIIYGEDSYIYITQNFIKKIEKLDLEEIKAQIFSWLGLIEDPELSRIAEMHTDKIFEAEDIRIPVPDMQRWAKIFTWRGPELEGLFEINDVFGIGSKAGVGILQGSSQKHGTGLLWVTLIITKE
jgi:uncharacterized protein YkwD